MAKLIIPTPLRKYTNNESSFWTDSSTVQEALRALSSEYPELKTHVFDDDGNLRSFVKVYVGDDDIEQLEGPDTQLGNEVTVSLVPAIAGGTPGEPHVNGSNGAPAALSKEELERYSRHLIIPDFNIEGQRKLKAAKVLVVGTGGLGAPLLQYLAAAGVGTLGIVDFDVVEDTNLQRQVLFTVDDIGKPKVEVAKKRLQALNPYITINTYNTRLTSENARDIIEPYDVVADGTDNFPTRYLVNDACVLLDKTNIYASIFRFEGQVSVFNYVDKNGNRGPNYRDLFPTPPPPGMVPSCAEGGVIGVLPGIIGSLQANEVIKVVTGVGKPLAGRLFLFDALSFESRTLNLSRQKNRQEITELIDYEAFCGIGQAGEAASDEEPVREMTVNELRQLQDRGEEVQIIDVREPQEYEIANIGGELIPHKEVEENVNRIATDKKVVVHCRSGARSAEAIRTLKDKYGFDNLYNLKGGILAWADEVDETMAKY